MDEFHFSDWNQVVLFALRPWQGGLCGAAVPHSRKVAPGSCGWHGNHSSRRKRPKGHTLPAWHMWFTWQPWIGKRPFLHQFLGHDMANWPPRLPLLLGVRVGWGARWRRASRRRRQGLGCGPGRQRLGRLPVDSCAGYKRNHDPQWFHTIVTWVWQKCRLDRPLKKNKTQAFTLQIRSIIKTFYFQLIWIKDKILSTLSSNFNIFWHISTISFSTFTLERIVNTVLSSLSTYFDVFSPI